MNTKTFKDKKEAEEENKKNPKPSNIDNDGKVEELDKMCVSDKELEMFKKEWPKDDKDEKNKKTVEANKYEGKCNDQFANIEECPKECKWYKEPGDNMGKCGKKCPESVGKTDDKKDPICTDTDWYKKTYCMNFCKDGQNN